jgi:hypothetical protein
LHGQRVVARAEAVLAVKVVAGGNGLLVERHAEAGQRRCGDFSIADL